MQQLHLVGVTTDHDSLIFSVRKGAKSGSFVLPLDENVVTSVAEAVRRMQAGGADLELPIELDTAATPQRRQSQLSPREIQDRLRGGRTLEEVATEAGVGEEWVARFAAPVEAERNQIIARSRGLVYAKSRLGDSREPLGLSVRWNLADRGVRMTDDDFDSAWSAYLLNEATWMVTFSFVSRRREQRAEWEVDLATDALTGRNRLASDLGYVEPGRRRRSLTSLQPPAAARAERSASSPPATSPAPASAAAKGSATSAATTKVPAKAATAAASKSATPAKVAAAAAKKPRAAKRKATKAPGAKKTAAKKTAAKKTPAKKTPAKKTTAKKTAAKKSPAKKQSTVKKKPPRKEPAKRAPAAKKTRSTTPAAASPAGAAKEAPPAPAVERSAPRATPNELGLRRLQMIGGTNGGAQAPRPGSEPGGGYAARAAATTPAPRRDEATSATSFGPPRHEPPPPPPPPPPPDRPAAPPVFDDELDSGLDVEPETATSSAGAADPAADAAEARRLERRRARAAARRPSAGAEAFDGTDLDIGAGDDDDDDWQAFAAAARGGSANRRAGGRSGAGEAVGEDGRVVTIRANRATPPTIEGEVILPPDRPPLRPAQPAAQPKRRRFGRSGR